jgi:hypothetical protein
MKLFDEIHRTRTGIKAHAEPKFNYINSSARKPYHLIRELLEEWFSSYPENAKKDLRARFRSSDDIKHLAAFFELYLYNLLRKIGFEVEVHPEIQGKSTHPEFKVYYSGQPAFYLEATLAAPSKEEIAARKRENIVYETIDKVNSPDFFLFVQIRRHTKENPSGRRWRKELEKWLSSLDYESIYCIFKENRFKDLPVLTLEDKGWIVEFKPIPKIGNIRGKPDIRPIGIKCFGLFPCRESERIRNAIIKKAKKYRKLNLPFIIAINATNELTIVDEEDILDALLGDFYVTLLLSSQGKIVKNFSRRKPNGAWIGPNGPRYKSVSAVIIFSNLCCENIANCSPELWHNPWSKMPLDISLLPLPQKLLNRRTRRFEFRQGKPIHEIFCLPQDWPFFKYENLP